MFATKEFISSKWKRKVNKLAKENGYEFYFLWSVWIEVLLECDPDESINAEWDYFVGVTQERDW